MDLNKQITERYGGWETSGFGHDSGGASVAEAIGIKEQDTDSGSRVGIIGSKFQSIYYAT
jgi:hypothetical protein